MEVQLKSIKHELHKCSTVDYVEEFAECIIKDEAWNQKACEEEK